MKLTPSLAALMSSSLLPLATIALAAAIFVADTITDLEIAVPVFYTAVILLSVRFCSRRGVILVCLGCIALTILSDLLTPGNSTEAGIINTVISVLAIAAATYLVLKIETAELAVADARAHLAHVARVTALGELTASIAHEVNQPIAATVINGNAALRWLAADPPDLEQAQITIERIVKDATRAGEVIGRVRKLAQRAPAQKAPCDVNGVIRDIVTLTANEIEKHRIVLQTDLNDDLGPAHADPVQLQQVVLNLVLNAIEAMTDTPEANRFLFIASAKDGADKIAVTVRDFGKGFGQTRPEQLFDAFHTTKSDGMGLGLTITRSIVEAHGGQIEAAANDSGGAVFRFTLPAESQGV
jgi:C4-dicarboxylate-specific signal transduction histidine kinase